MKIAKCALCGIRLVNTPYTTKRTMNWNYPIYKVIKKDDYECNSRINKKFCGTVFKVKSGRDFERCPVCHNLTEKKGHYKFIGFEKKKLNKNYKVCIDCYEVYLKRRKKRHKKE